MALIKVVKIQIKNIGNIKDLTFELNNGLTVFCGPNNTGKTYAAYIMYYSIRGHMNNENIIIKFWPKLFIPKPDIDIICDGFRLRHWNDRRR